MIVVTPLEGAGALAALATGLTGSPHCMLMCGPLACAPLPAAGPARRRALIGWQLGRVTGYAVVGVLLGFAGRGFAALLATRVQPFLPWIMAFGLVVSAFDLSRRLPAVVAFGRLARPLLRLGARTGPGGRAFALGAATPLLPCGLLWGAFLVAVGAGSPLGGGLVMVSFALGGVAALAAVQLGAIWTGRWPRAERVLRVAVPLLAAAALIWRALAGGHAMGGGPHPRGPA